jgi:hypothetical protein
VRLFYSQIKNTYLTGNLAHGTPLSFRLSATLFYRDNGPYTEANEKFLRENLFSVIPYAQEGVLDEAGWLAGLLEEYRAMNHPSLLAAEPEFLRASCQLDMFCAQMFFATMHEVDQMYGFYTRHDGEPVRVGVRPCHLVVADMKGATLLALSYEDMTQWGISLDKRPRPFVVKIAESRYVMFTLEQADLLN